MKRAVDPSISADALGSEPTARRVTDQIDPYAAPRLGAIEGERRVVPMR